MGDILPRPAGAFLFKCAYARCYGQPEKMAQFEVGPRCGTSQERAPENANCNYSQKFLLSGFSPEISKNMQANTQTKTVAPHCLQPNEVYPPI